MAKIQLLYVKNVISRKLRGVRQTLSFFMRVENISHHKTIDVLWAGEDGIWQTLPAIWHSEIDHASEYWLAETQAHLTADKSLPGNIQFALRYRTREAEYWDDNHTLNYSSQADSGIQLTNNIGVLNIDFHSRLHEGRKFIPVTVAIDQSVQAEKVTIHWTTDNWKHTHKTSCHFQRKYWDKTLASNARNPNQYGVHLWKGWLRVGDAFRLQYSIACESKDRLLWDNNYGNNYRASHEPLKMMILNLHCYQEDNQDYKFSQIAKAINELDVDVVCLQEVAELWNDGQGDWASNSAKIINDRLDTPYHIVTDWSHLGFNKYREGVAILSKYRIDKHQSRYVSVDHDPYSIHSRKVVMAEIHAPYIGTVNVFSAHLSWWEDGFAEQFQHLSAWASELQNEHVGATMLCGDFNITPGSNGYNEIVNSHEYDDQFLSVNSHGVFEKIFQVNDPYWRQYLGNDYRIDYIFMNKTSNLYITSGKVLFTEQDYGRVSDHCGYFMTFEPK